MSSEADQIRRVSEDARFAPYARKQNDQTEADSKSIYVGNVEYKTTEEELRLHFASYGVIARVTIVKDRFIGNPKGFAYIQFASKEAVTAALEVSGSLLNGRPITVSPKRTNVYSARRGRPIVKCGNFSDFSWRAQ